MGLAQAFSADGTPEGADEARFLNQRMMGVAADLGRSDLTARDSAVINTSQRRSASRLLF
jgi:hypothetical protein